MRISRFVQVIFAIIPRLLRAIETSYVSRKFLRRRRQTHRRMRSVPELLEQRLAPGSIAYDGDLGSNPPDESSGEQEEITDSGSDDSGSNSTDDYGQGDDPSDGSSSSEEASGSGNTGGDAGSENSSGDTGSGGGSLDEPFENEMLNEVGGDGSSESESEGSPSEGILPPTDNSGNQSNGNDSGPPDSPSSGGGGSGSGGPDTESAGSGLSLIHI